MNLGSVFATVELQSEVVAGDKFSVFFSSYLYKGLLPNNQSTLIGQLTHAWATTAHHVSTLWFYACLVFSFQLGSLGKHFAMLVMKCDVKKSGH